MRVTESASVITTAWAGEWAALGLPARADVGNWRRQRLQAQLLHMASRFGLAPSDITSDEAAQRDCLTGCLSCTKTARCALYASTGRGGFKRMQCRNALTFAALQRTKSQPQLSFAKGAGSRSA